MGLDSAVRRCFDPDFSEIPGAGAGSRGGVGVSDFPPDMQVRAEPTSPRRFRSRQAKPCNALQVVGATRVTPDRHPTACSMTNSTTVCR